VSTSTDKVVVARLREVAHDCQTLDDAAFALRHGEAYLLHWGELGASVPADPGRTTVRAGDVDTETLRQQPSELDVVVFKLRWSENVPYAHFITVGRTAINDVVLPHESISKYHAFLKKDGERYLLQDAGSTNGTFLDDMRVASTRSGEPMPLRSGARVRFGKVTMTFLAVGDFLRFARGVTAPPRGPA
jgi:hypothetical protein